MECVISRGEKKEKKKIFVHILIVPFLGRDILIVLVNMYIVKTLPFFTYQYCYY